MARQKSELTLPKGLADIDAEFMTQVLRNSGLITNTNEVVSLVESDVGMTAGYFSAVKKVKCTYREATNVQDSFVVKTWPPLEILPRKSIQDMFLKDIKGYQLDFYPHPKAFLAEYDMPNNRWILVMEDADTFAKHKTHEEELNTDDVIKMIPKMVDVAASWEGCHKGRMDQQLTDIGVDFWASEANLAIYKSVMPGGAKIVDKFYTLEGSNVVGEPKLDMPDMAVIFTRKIDAFFRPTHPAHGATCTLSHGDLRGDNIFFCKSNTDYPEGWFCIDFQLMFRGPIPSDLAYLMSSGSVLPEVYTGNNHKKVLQTFYNQFMAKTKIYKSYTYEQFEAEYMMMTAVRYVYSVGMGASYWQAGAYRNDLCVRVELGGQEVTEADLSPEELRQRMWWRKVGDNVFENFKIFKVYQYLHTLPDNLEGLGEWAELPKHLQ